MARRRKRPTGFFGLAQKLESTRVKGVSVDALHTAGCKLCPMNNDGYERETPKTLPAGPDNARYYFLGEAPGAQEDEYGKPFVGKSGQLLWGIVSEYVDDDVMHDIRVWNTVRCRPPDNRDPKTEEIECCRKYIEEDLHKVEPERLLLIGAQAFRWATGLGRHQRSVCRWLPLEFDGHAIWGMTVPHPAAVLRKGEESWEDTMLREGIARFFTDEIAEHVGPVTGKISEHTPMLQMPYMASMGGDIDPKITIAKTRQDILDFLTGPPSMELAFDLETHSDEKGDRVFRPYGKGAEILTLALSNVATGETLSIDESLVKDGVRYAMELIQMRVDDTLIAHNLAFDLEWLLAFCPDEVDRVHKMRWGCTRAQAYILNEKPSLSLNDLTMEVLGIRDFKKYSGVNVGGLKRERADRRAMYCGRDAAATALLYKEQSSIVRQKGLMGVYWDQVARIIPAVVAQFRGVHISVKRGKKLSKRLDGEIEELKNQIAENEDVIAQGGVDPDSPASVTKLLGKLGADIGSDKTKSGVSSGDRILEKFDHPVSSLIQDLRALNKLQNTYIDPVMVDGKDGYLWGDGLLHPRYNMSSLVTRRSSATAPNIQNQPKRRPEHSKWIRSLIRPPKGYRVVSVDYGQIEARVVAVCSKDDYLGAAFRSGYDIHSEWAKQILGVWPKFHPSGEEYANDPSQFDLARRAAKGFVFGLLFGSSLKGTAGYLNAPEEVARDLYNAFWDRLPDVKKWHKSLIDEYNLVGYITTPTGFRRHGPLRYHEVINTPIQSGAFDIVCAAWQAVVWMAKEKDEPWMIPPIQIHDDLVFFVPNDGLEDKIDCIVRTMLQASVGVEFVGDFPLLVEVSAGRDWGSMETIRTVSSDDLEV